MLKKHKLTLTAPNNKVSAKIRKGHQIVTIKAIKNDKSDSFKVMKWDSFADMHGR